MKHIKSFNESKDYIHTEEENKLFIDEISQLIELNHDASPIDITKLTNIIKQTLEGFEVKYVEKWKVNNKANLEKFISIIMNAGYSAAMNKYRKYGTKFRFGQFFDSLIPFLDNHFLKIENFPLKWDGPEITHYSAIATSHNIEQTIEYYNSPLTRTTESEIEIICTLIFRYGYSIACEDSDIPFWKKGIKKILGK
jgi:hypothetical protein